MINIEDVPGLETELQMVNTHIERLCRSNNKSMQKMLDWVLNARGKQIRPILTLLCARLKGKAVDATEVAAVIEICHTASLIHDDIIDEADTRRGQLSVQKKFGKEMAVYAGDFMIFSTIRRTGLKNKPWYGLMFDKLETMCDGEVSQFDNRYNTEITEEKYIENILGKTSANIGTAHMMQMVDKINEQNADIVVFAGDIFDNEYEALDDPEELIAVLQKIQSKHGVYACYGNHDVEEKILAGFTFGGNKKKESSIQMDEFLERAGIHLLQDEAVLIDDSFYLYGRPDAQRPGRGINMRKTAAELMGELDTEKPVIVIDHEPKELQELADAGVDIDLCGHTHDGQMFPANLITALMWENSYGYLKKDHMHTIVTSGVGLFGPNMRVGTIAEICPITVHFQYRNNI